MDKYTFEDYYKVKDFLREFVRAREGDPIQHEDLQLAQILLLMEIKDLLERINTHVFELT